MTLGLSQTEHCKDNPVYQGSLNKQDTKNQTKLKKNLKIISAFDLGMCNTKHILQGDSCQPLHLFYKPQVVNAFFELAFCNYLKIESRVNCIPRALG